ncbi:MULTISPECIES: hypothetical protein [Streptomyces]|uniref:Uncharacterized protein n=1 Tax=Streptomyces sp. 900129855 TaxID=3155129 RepID=A0ABV2ZLJ2_9ACTN
MADTGRKHTVDAPATGYHPGGFVTQPGLDAFYPPCAASGTTVGPVPQAGST